MTDVEHPRHSLSIDQQLALRTAATRLHGEFDGIFGTETIEQFLHSSYDQFASHSTIPNFLPLLAERFARQRLHALAKIEGHHDGKPTVLFLCVHTNTTRGAASVPAGCRPASEAGRSRR